MLLIYSAKQYLALENLTFNQNRLDGQYILLLPLYLTGKQKDGLKILDLALSTRIK